MSDTNIPVTRDSLWLRLLWMVFIGALMSVAQSVLGLMAVIQLIIMALNKAKPNAEIAAFGKRMGMWLGKATQFLTATSEQKPWPWSPLD